MANQQLLEYVQAQLGAGVEKTAIVQAAQRAGWSAIDISDAFTAIEEATASAAPKQFFSKPVLVGIVLLLLLGVGGYAVFKVFKPQDVLAQALTVNANIHTYSLKYTVNAITATGTVSIAATAEVDQDSHAMSGHSDITVSLPSSTTSPISSLQFSSDSIVVGNDVYVKMSFANPLLTLILKLPANWIHFALASTSLPGLYSNASYANQPQNAFSIFNASRNQITVNSEKEETLNGEDTLHYNVSLAPEFLNTLSSSLQSFYAQYASGGIDIWIDKKTAQVVQMSYGEGINFSMQMQILSINQPFNIEAPTSSVEYEQLVQNQISILNVPATTTLSVDRSVQINAPVCGGTALLTLTANQITASSVSLSLASRDAQNPTIFTLGGGYTHMYPLFIKLISINAGTATFSILGSSFTEC